MITNEELKQFGAKLEGRIEGRLEMKLEQKVDEAIFGLATEVERGFKEIREQFSGVFSRLDRIEENIATKEDVSKLDSKTTIIEQKIDILINRK